MNKFPLNRNILLPLVVIFLILINGYGYYYFISSYEDLDTKKNKENIISIVDKIDVQHDNITSLITDYANWDDTYNFIEDKNEHFIYNNFRDSQALLENLNLGFMIFFNNNHENIFAMFDEKIVNKELVLEKLKEFLKSNYDNTILSISQEHYLISKSEIKKSDLTGVSRGFVYGGALINLEDINKLYSNSLKFLPTSKTTFKNSFEINEDHFGNIIINFENKDENIINKINFLNAQKEVTLSLEYIHNREIYLNGKKHILTFNFIITILCLIMYYIFDKFISYQEKLNEELEKRVEQEISKQREQEQILIQQSKLASMGEMIGNIAHQWRQPLNSLGLTIQNINFAYHMGTLDEDLMKRTDEKAKLIIQNMSKTIDDFRNFFKVDKTSTRFFANDIIKNCLSMMYDTFNHHDIEIIEEFIDNEESKLFTLQNELSQAVLVMITNAKDALILDKIENPKITIKTTKNDDIFSISIKDNAKGIKKELINKIFEPYFTTKLDENGTGIGLYMAKIIIEKNMNGKIKLNTSPKGSEFIIELPINPKV